MEVAFGVIGLAGQVVDTSFKIKKVISTFQSAEEEFVNLKFKLDIVTETCESVRETIENERRNPSRTPSLLETRGPVVLEEIRKTLTKLEETLPKADIKGKRRKTRQGLHFLKKNDDIEAFNKRLDEKVFMLQTMLTLATNSRQLQLVRQLEAEQTIKHEALPVKITSEETRYYVQKPDIEPVDSYLPAKTTRVSLERTTQGATWVFGIQSVFEKRRVTKKSKWKNAQETTTVDETSSLAIRHASCSYAFQLMWWFNGPRTISCSLSIPHMVNRQTNRELVHHFYGLCYVGDIRGLQELFTDRTLTPTTLIEGATLFEWVASFSQPDMCRFLLSQNSKMSMDEHLLGSTSMPGRNTVDAIAPPHEVTDSYVDLIGMCLATQVPAVVQYRFLASTMCSPADMLMCFRRFRAHVLPDEWADFVGAAWDEAVLLFLKDLGRGDSWWAPPPDEVMYGAWFPLFGRIVEGGADAHRGIGRTRLFCTALWEVVDAATCPRNLESALRCWERVVWACGLDVGEYLAREWSLSDIMWNQGFENRQRDRWPRTLVQKRIGGHVFPMWCRRVDPADAAFEVREEFKDFGPHDDFSIGPSIRFIEYLAELDEVGLRRAWKGCDHVTMEPEERAAWPFGFSTPRDRTSYKKEWYRWCGTKEKATNVMSSLAAAQKLLRTRFERRQSKKLYKSGYLRRYKRLKDLPGAWE